MFSDTRSGKEGSVVREGAGKAVMSEMEEVDEEQVMQSLLEHAN